MILLVPPAQVAPPSTAVQVDLARYMGDWFEVARLPNPYQQQCARTTARYTLTREGAFSIVNGCLTAKGRYEEAKSQAQVVDPRTVAKLKLRFLWVFHLDYWILDLDADYRWALVGTPDRKYLWVISRTERLDPATLEAILAKAGQQGYDLSALIRS